MVLQKQMKLMPAADIAIAATNTKPHDAITGVISHPTNTMIGLYGFHAAKKFIKSLESREVIWRTSGVYGEQSFAGACKVFSDRSVTSLEANGLAYYR